MKIKDKNSILKFIENCGLETTRFYLIDNYDENYLRGISKKIDFPVKLLSNTDTHTLNAIVFDVKEFVYLAKVYVTNFDEVLITKVVGDREIREYNIDKIDSYNEKDKLKEIFDHLNVDVFHAHGYYEADKFLFEEVITPKDLVFKKLVK